MPVPYWPNAPGYMWSGALLVGFAAALIGARRAGLNVRLMYWLALTALASGLISANLLAAVVHGIPPGDTLLIMLWGEPKSLYGGLLGGALAAWGVATLRRIPALDYANAAAPAAWLAYAVGRVGCFLNGDDYGTLSAAPQAVVYGPGTEAFEAHVAAGWIPPTADSTLAVHPVQIYLALCGLLLIAVLLRLPRQDRLAGFLFGYGAARFAMEYFRGDFRDVGAGLSGPQWFSLALMLAGTLLDRGARRAVPLPMAASSS